MDSVEQLFKLHYAFVCNVINRYVRDKSKTEDIAQEMFAELWAKREQITIHTSATAYLRRMAVSRSLNYLRDSKKHNWDDLDASFDLDTDLSGHIPEVILKMEEEELRQKLDTAIQSLPEKCRIVFLLNRQDELSYAEVAEQLNISIKTVENQIGKALKLLRTAVSEHRGKAI
jgi:RNA polymerase sigma-70 factor (ECF subfamily)